MNLGNVISQAFLACPTPINVVPNCLATVTAKHWQQFLDTSVYALLRAHTYRCAERLRAMPTKDKDMYFYLAIYGICEITGWRNGPGALTTSDMASLNSNDAGFEDTKSRVGLPLGAELGETLALLIQRDYILATALRSSGCA